MSITFKPRGSWDKRLRTSFALPEYVLSFLRLQSMVTGRDMQDIVLEAVINYYKMQPPQGWKFVNT